MVAQILALVLLLVLAQGQQVLPEQVLFRLPRLSVPALKSVAAVLRLEVEFHLCLHVHNKLVV